MCHVIPTDLVDELVALRTPPPQRRHPETGRPPQPHAAGRGAEDGAAAADDGRDGDGTGGEVGGPAANSLRL